MEDIIVVKRIYILPDGPYEVEGGAKLSQATNTVDEAEASVDWMDGKAYDTDETYYLCRCGHSSQKPFCDGTHEKVDFEGRETAPHEFGSSDQTSYKGKNIELKDNESLCASMRFCDRGRNAWKYAEDSADANCMEMALDEVKKCPSGRLEVFDKEGNRIEPELDQEINAIEDAVHGCRGPLWVKGGIPVEGADGAEYQRRNRVTLCRCGESKNKPFCDSAHVYCKHMEGFDE